MNKNSKTRGRPPKDNTLSATLPPIRVTPEEKKKYKDAAERAGMTLSAWFKLIAREKLSNE
jgi:hypothetical protein